MSETLALSARGIFKSFGSVRALQGVDLDVGRGEIVGLIGDNGAGKSTLIKILSGFEVPDAGTIAVNGQIRVMRSPKEARALGIETVYQEQALADDVTVARNLFMGKELHRRLAFLKVLDDKAMRVESKKMLDELRLRVDVDQEARFCSGGERQGIAISRAIYFNARVVILDEPTNALGVVAVDRVLGLVAGLKERGISCIFISHNIQHVVDICDRIVMFVHGSKVLDTARSETSADQLIAMLNARSGATISAPGEPGAPDRHPGPE
ncbi:MAG: ATP-binding cassette domain-containing protein [Bifidobacteriaceae bacterium]|jgi:simple sugar transport system ATP-binding protein|nr:ATP-binding cassette domain-containing protein [Bifidobacteriaceae bacterium]